MQSRGRYRTEPVRQASIVRRQFNFQLGRMSLLYRSRFTANIRQGSYSKRQQCLQGKPFPWSRSLLQRNSCYRPRGIGTGVLVFPLHLNKARDSAFLSGLHLHSVDLISCFGSDHGSSSSSNRSKFGGKSGREIGSGPYSISSRAPSILGGASSIVLQRIARSKIDAVPHLQLALARFLKEFERICCRALGCRDTRLRRSWIRSYKWI